MLLLFVLLLIWCLVGWGIYWFAVFQRNSHAVVTRNLDKRICRVGDDIEVLIKCQPQYQEMKASEKEIEPWDILLLLDQSSSMGIGSGSPMEIAKEAAINLVGATPKSFRIGLITFDSTAQEAFPLGRDKKALTRQLRTVNSGGGTNIAGALGIAEQVVKNISATDNQHLAVILLTDGEDDSENLLQASNGIKGQGATLITVAVGEMGQQALKEIASSKEDFYHASDISSLLGIYNHIGQRLVGTELSNLAITEYFNNEGCWRIKRWGEPYPSSQHIEENDYTWYLPNSEEQIQLKYSLEALHIGWQKVATKSVKLVAKNSSGDIKEFSHNYSHVLVLPDGLWRLFSWFTTPLFFMLFGKYFREQISSPIISPDAPPTVEELVIPKLLSGSPNKRQHINHDAILTIGLGYTGIHGLTHMKRLLRERESRLETSRLAFLGVDTASEEYFPSPSSADVSLAPDERLNLDAALEPLLEEHAKSGKQEFSWLQARKLKAGALRPDLHRGTGGIRSLARLALFANQAAMEKAIKSKLEAIGASTSGNTIEVIIAGSAGGGTATGMLLDTCWLVRHIASSQGYANVTITVVLADPLSLDVSESSNTEKQQRLHNFNALSIEMDRVGKLKGSKQPPMPGLAPESHWFDRCFMASSNHNNLRSENQIQQNLGSVITAWIVSDNPQHNEHRDLRSFVLEQEALYDDPQRNCFHRLQTLEAYSFPLSSTRYLSYSMLHKMLSQNFLQSRMDANGGITKLPLPEEVIRLWIERASKEKNWQTQPEFSWVFFRLLNSNKSLAELLQHGEGPLTTFGITDSLSQRPFMDLQRVMFSTDLKNSIQFMLNNGVDSQRQKHNLNILNLVLRFIEAKLRELLQQALILSNHITSNVAEEAKLLSQLGHLLLKDIVAMHEQFMSWQDVLGDAPSIKGLTRNINDHLKELGYQFSHELTTSVPVFGLELEQLDVIIEEHTETIVDTTISQLYWRYCEQSQDWKLGLNTHNTQEWALQDMDQAAVQELSWLLSEIVEHKLAEANIDVLQLQPEQALRKIPSMESIPIAYRAGNRSWFLPYTEGAGAAIQLSQQQVIASVETEHLVGGILFEASLHPEQLWPTALTYEELPFVTYQEHRAYQLYFKWCRKNQLEPVRLPPTLVEKLQSEQDSDTINQLIDEFQDNV